MKLKKNTNLALAKQAFSPKQMVVLCTWFQLPVPKVTETRDGFLGEVNSWDVEEEMGIKERGNTSVTTTDVAVARILLSTVAKQLPQWASVDYDKLERDNSWAGAVVAKPIVALTSRIVLTIDWAQTPAGGATDEYRATWLPGFDKVVITCSTDSEGFYGHTDFALGYCEPGADLVTHIGEILKGWWIELRQDWDHAPWSLLDAGIVDKSAAIQLRDEVWSDDQSNGDDC